MNCRDCGNPVESLRECYVMPVCYACLPPPEPLPVNHLCSKERSDVLWFLDKLRREADSAPLGRSVLRTAFTEAINWIAKGEHRGMQRGSCVCLERYGDHEVDCENVPENLHPDEDPI